MAKPLNYTTEQRRSAEGTDHQANVWIRLGRRCRAPYFFITGITLRPFGPSTTTR